MPVVCKGQTFSLQLNFQIWVLARAILGAIHKGVIANNMGLNKIVEIASVDMKGEEESNPENVYIYMVEGERSIWIRQERWETCWVKQHSAREPREGDGLKEGRTYQLSDAKQKPGDVNWDEMSHRI